MSDRKRDDAARAAWLSFIAGRTQDEIAKELDVSRQAAQRLIAFAVSEGLIKFRLDHPISSCMELASRIKDRHNLEFCDVMPSSADEQGSVNGVAIAAAARMERLLHSKAPLVVSVGTGRTLRAAVDQMSEIDRPQHKVVSLVGSMAADGHASPYDVVMRLADKIKAQRFPMPAPVLLETVEDRAAMEGLRALETLASLRAQSTASFLGISEIAWGAPVHRDGFMKDEDVSALIASGAVGEITSWAFNEDGEVIDCTVNARVSSLPLECPPQRLTVVVGVGDNKVAAIKAALNGGLMSALITDEQTAVAVLSDQQAS